MVERQRFLDRYSWNPFAGPAYRPTTYVSRGSSEDSEAALSQRMEGFGLGEVSVDNEPLSMADLSSKLAVLREACRAAGKEEYMDDYTTPLLHELLLNFKPDAIVSHMTKSHEAYDKVIRLEKSLNPVRLDRMLRTGAVFTRGFEKTTGRPIIWATEDRFGWPFPEPDYYVSVWSWICRLAMQKRPEHDPYYIVLLIDTNRPALYFSLASAYRLWKHAMDLSFPHTLTKKAYFVSFGRFGLGSKMLLDAAKRILPTKMADKLDIIADLKDLRSLIENPVDIPDWVDPQGGTPFTADDRTLGKYRDYMLGTQSYGYREVFKPGPAGDSVDHEESESSGGSFVFVESTGECLG